MPSEILLCDCGGSQQLDGVAIERATGLACRHLHSHMCTLQLGQVAKAMEDGDVLVACGQESAVFKQLAEELQRPGPLAVDLRDRAGWSEEAADATPKIAALIAEASLTRPPAKTTDIHSQGLCLVIGPTDVALQAAEQLCDVLAVTVLLTDDGEAPFHRKFDIILGDLEKVSGSLGKFRLTIAGLRQCEPSGRGAFRFGEPVKRGESDCDLILDLTGGSPLFPAHRKRDGYFRADPGSPLEVARKVFDVSHMTGTFEKPLYVQVNEHLCAHSRAEQPGCSKCLEICPTGAISPAGDHVTIDPMICAGCGACSSVCPSEAVAFDDPPVGFLFKRMETLATAFREAGGQQPRLLVHDKGFGTELIMLAARFGRGLPAAVIPLELDSLEGFGHAEALAALATGFSTVELLMSPRTERQGILREMEVVVAIMGEDRVRIIDESDPDAVADLLYEARPVPSDIAPIIPFGGRREVARNAARNLRPDMEGQAIPLPSHAAYGAVIVDTDACTLCLACASLCPAGALGDNPDLPQLRFQEDACLQCGLCANICPEDAIALQPQMNLADDVFRQVVVNEEEPFACIVCGAPFGVKSTVERIMSQLAGKHSMFLDSAAGQLIRMCDDCRVRAQFHATDNPMEMGPRPRVRTTEDYLRKPDSEES